MVGLGGGHKHWPWELSCLRGAIQKISGADPGGGGVDWVSSHPPQWRRKMFLNGGAPIF